MIIKTEKGKVEITVEEYWPGEGVASISGIWVKTGVPLTEEEERWILEGWQEEIDADEYSGRVDRAHAIFEGNER